MLELRKEDTKIQIVLLQIIQFILGILDLIRITKSRLKIGEQLRVVSELGNIKVSLRQDQFIHTALQLVSNIGQMVLQFRKVISISSQFSIYLLGKVIKVFLFTFKLIRVRKAFRELRARGRYRRSRRKCSHYRSYLSLSNQLRDRYRVGGINHRGSQGNSTIPFFYNFQQILYQGDNLFLLVVIDSSIDYLGFILASLEIIDLILKGLYIE